MNMRDFSDVAICTAVETPYRRHPSAGTTADLLAEAFTTAIKEAGFNAQQVDGLGVASFTLSPDHAIDMAWRLGISPRWCMDDCNGGASAINMLQHAARAIQCGDANVIVLLAGDRFEPQDFRNLVENYNVTTREWLRPLETGGPNAMFAMLTQAHADRFGLSREDYGSVCIAQREWAALNPLATYRIPLTFDAYLGAPTVAEPLGRYDCVPVVSGANAVVLARSDLLQSDAHVEIRALRCGYNPDHQMGDGLQTSLAVSSQRLWSDCGMTPTDMHIVSVYDDYPVMVLVQLADLGFAPDGNVKALIHRIKTKELAVNTSGGQLSVGQAGAAGGMHGLVETITQLNGQAGSRQVPSARRGVVSGYGMVQYRYGMCANAVVLESVRRGDQ